jgi:hypothetical protein
MARRWCTDAAWRSSDTDVAHVEQLPPPGPSDSTTTARVLVRGVRPGFVEVTASARDVVGRINVRVIPRVAALAFVPSRDTSQVGDTIDILVVLRDTAGGVIARVPLRFAVDSGLELGRAVWDSLRVVAVDTGTLAVSASFRRATGTVRLVVTRQRPLPNARLSALVQRKQLLDADAFGLALEVHDDAVTEHRERDTSHVIDVRHGTAVHRRASLCTEHEVL